MQCILSIWATIILTSMATSRASAAVAKLGAGGCAISCNSLELPNCTWIIAQCIRGVGCSFKPNRDSLIIYAALLLHVGSLAFLFANLPFVGRLGSDSMSGLYAFWKKTLGAHQSVTKKKIIIIIYEVDQQWIENLGPLFTTPQQRHHLLDTLTQLTVAGINVQFFVSPLHTDLTVWDFMHPYFLGTTRKRFFLTCHPAQIAIRYEGWHVNPGDTLHCFFMVAFYLPISQAHVYLRSCLNRRIKHTDRHWQQSFIWVLHKFYFCHCWRFSLIDTISIICIFLHNHQPRTCFDSMILWGGRFLVSYSSNGGVVKRCWRSQKIS